MKIESQFHCDLKSNFPEESPLARAFLYTDYSIEPHWHEFYEINIVLSGSGFHLIEENEFSARKGDVFVIPPNIVHAYIDSSHMDVYHLLLKPSFIDMYLPEHADVPGYDLFMEIEPFLRHRYDQRLFLHLNAQRLACLLSDIDIIDESRSPFRECLPLKHCTIAKIVYWMSALLYRQIHGEGNDLLETNQAIIRTLEYIHHNFAQRIDIDALCKCAIMSRPTFMRKFKEVCDCTPMHYLMAYRAAQARKLLEEGRLSKTQVAHECGFYDLSHMEKHLKEYDRLRTP